MTNPFISDPADRIDWKEPKPLQVREHISDFPLHALTTPLAEFVKAVRTSVQAPNEMTGPAVLGALAAAIQARYEVHRRSGGVEQANLYTLIVGDPGTRKSAVQKLATEPLSDLEKQLRQEAAPEVQAHKRRIDMMERQVSALLEKAKNQDPEAEAEYEEAARKLDSMPRREMPQLITSEITPEAIPDLIAGNGQAIALIAAEGDVLGTFLGRYSGAQNLTMLTAGYSGDNIVINRKNKEPVSTEGIALNILLFLQPSVLNDLVKALGEGTQGVIERFLIAMPREVIGKKETDIVIPPEVLSRYSRHIQAVARHCRDLSQRVALTLSDEAWETFRPFSDNITAMTETGEWSEDDYLKGMGNKFAGTTLRLAAVLHVSHELAQTGQVSREISGDAMRNAQALAGFYAGQLQRVLGVTRGKTDMDYAEKALAAIRRHHLTTVNARELARRSSIKSKDEGEEALLILEDHGYIAEIQTPGRPGRKAPTYVVSPLVVDRQTPRDLENPVTN